MRALILTVAMAGCASRPLFVDQVEDGRALLIHPDGMIERVPASTLPPDAGEGDWLGDPPDSLRPGRVAALRVRLAQPDDGRDLALP